MFMVRMTARLPVHVPRIATPATGCDDGRVSGKCPIAAGRAGLRRPALGRPDFARSVEGARRTRRPGLYTVLTQADLDPIFLPDSYGYRPRKSALDAVGVTRERCWKYDWVLEFDIRGLFDNINHELLLRAVRKQVKCKWALIYIERWLKAPMEQDGIRKERTLGTPQGV